ncbi:MAG: right-handed parallel beta-helix repeat-containing protein [Mesorhizobium sp.]|nr:right-handed parallel beta-helix repeat-containing protein [Mesorhizobium sp.]MCO5164408.1 right-handed parallel beta-helix repeat-containing protein [Mesorhizobium sp.]
MRVTAILTAAAITAVALIGFASGASAQATRTWVSGVGDDANPCSRTAPCKTFAGAISKTAAGGEINCIDPGGFGAVTITKSMTIACEDVEAGILNAGTNGVIVNAAATDIVVLRGLDFDSGPGSPGLNGVRFLAGAALHIEDCVIRDNGAATPNGNGVLFTPSNGTSELFISNSQITGNGTATTGTGVHVAPTGAANAKVSIDNTVIANNSIGVRGVSNGTTGTVDISIANSELSGGTFHGVVLQGDTGTTKVMVNSTRIVNNANQGIRAIGANSTVRVGSSVISGNLTGLNAVSGASILSYLNNQLNGNGTDGAFTGAVALQ